MTIDTECGIKDKERMLYYSAVKLDNCFTACGNVKTTGSNIDMRNVGYNDCRCKSYDRTLPR